MEPDLYKSGNFFFVSKHFTLFFVLYTMVSLEQQERAVFLNSQYQDNSEVIHRLKDTLLHDIDTLDLAPKDLSDAKQYIQDKGIFFLSFFSPNED